MNSHVVRIIASLLHLGLLATGLASLWLTAPPNTPLAAGMIMATVLYLPIAIFLPATLRRDKRLLTWFSYLLMFYFCAYVAKAVEPPPSGDWGVALSIVTALLFVACAILIRLPIEAPTPAATKQD